ncbi:MAG: TonB family protein [Deltaproteobacteria bacterium]|nr:TonB family protein [Deltaproteobacteria bacterium]
MTAVRQESDRAPALMTQAPCYRPRRLRHAARRCRPVVRSAGAKAPIGRDPLSRPPSTGLRRAGIAGLVVIASIGAHAALIFGSVLVGEAILRDHSDPARDRAPLEVAIVEPPPPPAPQRPLPKEQTRKAPAPPAQPVVVPEAHEPEPPPDPTRQPEAPTPKGSTPRRIVGLSLESTTAGGGGPSFAVGNTRMGATDQVAKDPSAALAPITTEARVSNRVPTATAAFKPPQKTAEVKPEFPAALRARGAEADVVLAVLVATDGSVVSVEVVKAPSAPEFAAAAVAAAKLERYAPATKDGVAVSQLITFTVRFRLTDY